MNVMRSTLLSLLIAGSFAPSPSAAQTEELFGEGAYVVTTFPTGDWGEIAGLGFGLDGTSYFRPDATRLLNLRSSFGLAYNFGRTVDVPSANLSTGDRLELETSNTGLWFGIGPELGRAQGDFRGFVFGTVGLNVHWTNSELSGTVGGQPYSANVGHSGTVFAWSAGFGFRKSMGGVPGGRLELSAEYRSGVDFKYVVPDEVTSSGGTVFWDRTSHNADQIIVRLGTVLTDL